MLGQEAKNEIDVAKLPEEYRTAVEMQTENDSTNYATLGKIKLDFSKDLELYQGLDELIYLNPMEISVEHREQILELCRICPEIKICDNLGLGYSTAQEYINSEMWIASVFKEMDENWSSIQKIAYMFMQRRPGEDEIWEERGLSQCWSGTGKDKGQTWICLLI